MLRNSRTNFRIYRTSYFLTNTELLESDWEDTGDKIDCSTAAICGIDPNTTYNYCSPVNIYVGAGIDQQVIEYIKSVVYNQGGDLTITQDGSTYNFCVPQKPSQLVLRPPDS